MKRIIIVFLMLFSTKASIAQADLKKYYIPQIDFTFYLPNQSKISTPESHDKDSKAIFQAEVDDKNGKLSTALSVSLTAITQATKQLIGDTINFKKFLITQDAQNGLKVDTSFTQVRIGKYEARKLLLMAYDDHTMIFDCNYIINYNNQYLLFKFMSFDKETANNFMHNIETGSFGQ